MPKVTVAMPVYNDAIYVREAIDSILVQSFADFQLLIVDDGSTDATPDIITSYADERIRIIHHKQNRGRPFARNTALDAADSQYFAWMDADDISLPQRLQCQIDFMDIHPDISVCGTAIKLFHEKKGGCSFPVSPIDISGTTVFHPAICNPAAMLRMDDMRKQDVRFDIAFQRAEDFVFWIEVLLVHSLKAANLPRSLYKYRFFTRPSTPQWHRQAILDHLVPAIGLHCSLEEVDIHTGLVCHKRGDLIQSYGIDAIFAWLERLDAHCHEKKFSFAPVVTRIAREQVERTIAYATNPINALLAYRKTRLSQGHQTALLYGRTFARVLKSVMHR